jgi:hypothetical protein
MKTTIWIAMMAGVLVAQDNPTPGGRGKGARSGGPPAVEAGIPGLSVVEAQVIVLNGVRAEFVTGVMQGPVVKNAPYAAEAVTEATQRLFDGNEIVRKTTAKQYRDSEGRERREEGMGAILITDPVEKVRYTIRPESKTAAKQAYAAAQVFTVRTTEGGGQTFTIGGGRGANLPVLTGASGPGVKQEDLGTRTVEGVQAQGTRSTRTIAAGEIGNARPIEVVDERWYSPDLQLTVMTRHSDPREGETVFRLTNIQRIEQVRSLFEVPPGYAVNDPNMARELERVTNQGRGGGRSANKSKE